MQTLEERAYWLKQAHLLDEELGTEDVEDLMRGPYFLLGDRVRHHNGKTGTVIDREIIPVMHRHLEAQQPRPMRTYQRIKIQCDDALTQIEASAKFFSKL